MDLSDDHSSLMPMLTLTVGNTEIKPVRTPDYFSQDDSDGSNPDSDPNRFNAYLNRGSELWTHWSWLGGQGKMSLMRCNYCLVNKQLKNAPKCRRHLIKCPKTPEIVRRYFEKKEVEATRVSALMRELRSKEIKFPRNSEPHHKPQSDNHHKLPVPTANDLKHLQLKQHNQVSINNVIVKKDQQQQHSPADMSLSKMHMKSEPVDMIKSSYSSMPNNKSSKHEVSPMTVPNHGSRNDNHLINELSIFYQQIMVSALYSLLLSFSCLLSTTFPAPPPPTIRFYWPTASIGAMWYSNSSIIISCRVIIRRVTHYVLHIARVATSLQLQILIWPALLLICTIQISSLFVFAVSERCPHLS